MLASLNPGVANLVTILASWTGEHAPSVALRYGGRSYRVVKSDVAEAIVQKLDSIREESGIEERRIILERCCKARMGGGAVENIRAVKKALGIGEL